MIPVAVAKIVAKMQAKNAAKKIIERGARKSLGRRIAGGIVPGIFGKPHSGLIGNVTNIGWAFQGIQSMTENFFPRVNLSCTVKIWGSRNATIGNLYFLAIAIASNVVPTFKGSTRTLQAGIDHTNQFVEVLISCSAGGLTGTTVGTPGIVGAPTASAGNFLRTAPKTDIDANTYWPEFLSAGGAQLLPGVAPSSPPIPMLKQAVGPMDNPYPAFDKISRSTDLYAIFSQALTGSCALLPYPTNQKYTVTGASTLKLPGNGLPINQIPGS